MNVAAIFKEVLKLKSSAERQAYIEERCGTNAALNKELHSLLDAHQENVDAAASEHTSGYEHKKYVEKPTQEVAGSLIGPYKLLQKMGEGGMGTVWVAEQEKPVKRRVAIKLVKPGMDSAQVIRRFEAERQALAMMDHTNIAKVLDAGETANGRPYFVMELVKGVPITKYCDQTHASIEKRLELFIQVCAAVQHAHQKGIIHRDIKPGNVLVALQDGKPVPKVIDFGVAKALHSKLGDRTMFTEIGQVIGTLEYMAPEQAEMSAMDIDTRADIYALGVLLYELLTGSTPITSERMKSAAFTEVIRLIKEEEPPRPSTRLTQSKQSLASLASLRKIDPNRFSSVLKGELDWVVLKALEKDRTRRYETADGLARDIQRYLADEVVEARPPSTAYRFKKFVRRNKGRVVAACLVLLALLGGIIGTTYEMFEARRAAVAEREAKLEAEAKQAEAEKQQRRAESSEKLAGERLVQVEVERKRAEEEKRVAVAVKNFLQVKLLGQADATNQANALLEAGDLTAGTKSDPTIRELLDRAAEELSAQQIESNFPNQPQLQAELLLTVGNTYRGVGAYDKAISLLKRSVDQHRQQLGNDHADTLESMYNLAVAYQAAGEANLALPLHQETLDRRKETLGAKDPRTLTSMGNLAMAYTQAGRLDRALPLFEQASKLFKETLGVEKPQTLISMHNLAWAYAAARKPKQAIPLYDETLQSFKTTFGPEHPNTLICMHNLASAYESADKINLAIELYEETLALKKTVFGPNHPETLITMGSLAMAYQAAGKKDLALPLFEDTRRLFKETLGIEAPKTLISMHNLARAYMEFGKIDLAVPLYEETLALKKAKLGPDNLETLVTMNNLAAAYLATEKYDLALPLFQEVHRLQVIRFGAGNADTVATEASIGLLLLKKKAYAEAEPLLSDCLTHRAKLQPNDWTTYNTRSLLGGAMLGQKKYDQAEPLLLTGYRGMVEREKFIPAHGARRIPEAMDRLIQYYTETNKPDEVKRWQAEKAAMEAKLKEPTKLFRPGEK
jgi:serine/threonine protein kinase/tetratricopeptide (TPR) repeat protein